jgi:hypothetical protein
MKPENLALLSRALEHALCEWNVAGKTPQQKAAISGRMDELSTVLHETRSYHRFVDCHVHGACDALAESVPMFDVICAAITCGVGLGLAAARTLEAVGPEEVLQ